MPRRGENIYKRKDGRWEGRYIKSYVSGKAKYGYVYAKTYKEVKEKLNTNQNEISKVTKYGTLEKHLSNNLQFEFVSQRWLESINPYIKESSYIKYTNLLNSYILPCFKSISISSISRNDVITFCNELQYTGGKKGTGLSSKTVNCVISVLKNIFKYATQCENVTVADIDKITIKQSSQKPLRILSIQEQQKIHDYLLKDLTPANLGILLCLHTGIRIGEVCALQWNDIYFEEQCLYIHKTMQRIQSTKGMESKTCILVSKPKSESSIRRIPIPEKLFHLLRKLEKAECAYILTGQQNKFIEPRTLQYRFKSILKSCGINDANFHSLRHTFATRCIELGFDIKSLSEILGHASVNITLNKYVHPSMELKQKNMNMVSELFAVK